jgi:putative tricarboxylic transport membrane protein
MSWLGIVGTGFGEVFSWPAILIPVAGTLLAMVTAFLPGIGNASLAAVLLVMTADWSNEAVLMLFGALTGGATFMGSVTAILFNIPGSASSAPSLLDGFPMNRNGYPKTALACAATASAVGSVIGVVLLISLLPIIRPFLLQFGPLERFLVGLWGLLTILSLKSHNLLKSTLMAVLGLVVALIGLDPRSGIPRFSFGSLELSQGFSLIPVLLGVFTLSELLTWAGSVRMAGGRVASPARDDSVLSGVRAVFRYPGLTLRSSLIGTLVGMIPGVGGTVAGFVAYGQASAGSRRSDGTFGQGDIRGVIAPEAAVDAKDGGSLLPALAFGLPGSEAGVMLLAVFSVHGIVPGLQLLDTQASLVAILIIALLVSNLLTSVLGLGLTPALAKVRSVRLDHFAFPCLLISLLAVLQLESRLFDGYTALLFGLIGYFWRINDWPLVPFVVAFVLGELIETNLVLSLQLVELGRIVPWDRGGSLLLIGLICSTLFWLLRRKPSEPARSGQYASDLIFSLAILLFMSSITLIAWLGEDQYSFYSKGIVAIAAGLALLTVVRGFGHPAMAEVGQTARKVAKKPFMPAAHTRHLISLVVLPFFIWAFGITLAVGLIALLWYLDNKRAGIRYYLYPGLFAGFSSLLTYLAVDVWGALVLPAGIVWRYLG